MSEKLRNILTLALRPETGDGEAAAALSAARRLVAKDGITGVFGETVVEAKTKTMFKVRDRVVLRDINFPPDFSTHTYTLTVPPVYLHTIFQHMTRITYEQGMHLELIKCEPKNKTLSLETVMEFKLQGRERDIDLFYKEMRGYVEQIRASRGRYAKAAQFIAAPVKQRGLIVRIIKRLAAAL